MYIMIVDPSEISRSVMEEQLLMMGVKSSDIHLFIDGQSALESARKESIDMLFTTLNLPVLDGIDLVDLVLAEKPSLVSRLFVLSSSDKEVFNDVKEIGAKRFIKKPINAEIFQHFVKPEVEKLILNI